MTCPICFRDTRHFHYVSGERVHFCEDTMAKHAFQRTSLSHEGKRIPAYRAECKCGTVETVKATGHTASLPQEVIAKKFGSRGWSFTKDTATCPRCNGAEERMTNVTQFPKAETPRQMTPADRRRVFREIDDNWNEPRGRYEGSTTDQTIATKLDVPRAWVEQCRKEAFGETGRNEDFDKLVGNLKNLKGEADRHGAAALDLAGKYEKLSKDYQDLLDTVQGMV